MPSARSPVLSRHTALALAMLLPGLQPTGSSWAATTGSATASAPALEAEIRQIDGERVAALVKADFGALRRLIHPDCVYTHASGLVESGNDYVQRLERGDLRYLAMQYVQPPLLRIHDDTTAVVSGRVQLTSQGRTSATPNDRLMMSTSVYVRQAGNWRLVSFQSTPVPAPVP